MTITSPERVTGLRNDEAALLRRLYRTMAITRRLDLEAAGLRLAGALPTYTPLRGSEAAQIGSVSALDPARDAVFAPRGALGIAVATGADALSALTGPDRHSGGDELTVSHAVGWALGAKLDRTTGVALAYLAAGSRESGRGREADRESMAVAVRSALPVVFLRSSGGDRRGPDRPALAGMPAVRIDADDALAVFRATAAAADRARHGLGPVLLETASSVRHDRDPLALCAQRLRATGTVGDGFFAEAAAIAEELAERVRDDVSGGRGRPVQAVTA